MHRFKQIALTSVATALFAAALASTASANRISISNRHVRITFDPVGFIAGFVRCDMTLEGSFHSSTMPKIAELLIGYITGATVNACTNPSTLLVETLPWHIRYERFAGTLPAITALFWRLIGFGYRYDVLGHSCLYRSSVANPGRFRADASPARQIELIALSEATIPLSEGSLFDCIGNLRLEGLGRIRLLNAPTTLIFVRLI